MDTDFVEFRQLRKVGVFSYLVISCLKIYENDFGCCEAGNGHGFRFQRSGTKVNEGAVHGQPTHYFWGLLKTVREVILDRNCPCVLLA